MNREEAAKKWEWVVENFNDSAIYLWPDERQKLIESISLLRNPIPDPIIRKPRPSEEQVRQMQALVTLGFRWLAKDENDEVVAFKGRPDKGRGQWQGGGEHIVLCPFMPTNCLMDLPDWSDPAPLDIVQTLREAGVEMEVEK